MAIVYNEARYITEWIEYHLLVGVEHFWLGDNLSTDNTTAVLAPYLTAGIVTCSVVSGAFQQRRFYNDLLPLVRGATFWIAVIDVDEFLVPMIGHSVPDILHPLEFAAGIDVNIVRFASNGKTKREPGLVIERFPCHTALASWRFTKVILNPRVAIGMDIHESGYIRGLRPRSPSGVYHPIPDSLLREPEWRSMRINHYFTKSYEEWTEKRNRGRASDSMRYSLKDIDDLHDVVANDSIMDWCIPIIKDRLAQRIRTQQIHASSSPVWDVKSRRS
jgi:hypothetical protein